MATIPRLQSRFAGYTTFLIRDPGPDVRTYRFYAADTLDNAFNSANYLFSVDRLAFYRSPSLVQRRLGISDSSTRGLTKVCVNFEDYWQAGGTYPHDANQLFMRIAEVNAAGVERPQGPILVVPPPGFYDVPRPAMTVSGTAPDVAADPIGVPPDGAMQFAVPRATDNIRIRNLSGSSLFVGFDAGQNEMTIPANSTEVFYDAAVSDIFVHGVGATPNFEIRFALSVGSRS